MAPPSSPNILEALQPLIVRCRGAWLEAIVCSVLLQVPQFIRGFEFATLDGVLDCTEGAQKQQDIDSFAQRLWTLDDQLRLYPGSRLLVGCDVKSSAAFQVEDQRYLATIAQCQSAGFFIGICNADPNFIDVIPNNRKPPLKPSQAYVQINTARKPSIQDPLVYGCLNPCGGPYRMPLDYLPEALRRIRACASGQGEYVNPWTRVPCQGWTPKSISTTDQAGVERLLFPAEQSQQYTAYRGIKDFWRAVRNVQRVQGMPIQLEFVSVQPLLADFKLVIEGTRQVFVQYKIEGRVRARIDDLRDVPVSRGKTLCDGTRVTRWYFSTFDRFDFLFYEFEFSNPSHVGTSKQVFCIPHRCLPDHFFDGSAQTVDFGVEAFQKYRVDVVEGWPVKVMNILETEQHPRRINHPPLRPSEFQTPISIAIQNALKRTTPTRGSVSHDSSDRGLASFHQVFFYAIMELCARRGHGLLLVTAPDHPTGDFAYLQYQWTEHEQEDFILTGKPPKVLHELDALTLVTPLYCFAKNASSTSRGPIITSAQFRRLNSCTTHSLILFDPTRPDARDHLGPLYLIPSEDISPTLEQVTHIKDNLSVDKNTSFNPERAPAVAQLLHSGHAISDYLLAGRGPFILDDNGINGWCDILAMLDRFAGVVDFPYPRGHDREPAAYCVSIRQLQTRLAEELEREQNETSVEPEIWASEFFDS